jgi:hypothetical protein
MAAELAGPAGHGEHEPPQLLTDVLLSHTPLQL